MKIRIDLDTGDLPLHSPEGRAETHRLLAAVFERLAGPPGPSSLGGDTVGLGDGPGLARIRWRVLPPAQDALISVLRERGSHIAPQVCMDVWADGGVYKPGLYAPLFKELGDLLRAANAESLASRKTAAPE